MGLYLKKFENHTQYETYINGSGAILPNVSYCIDTPNEVHYNPLPETRVVAKYNVTSTSSPTMISNDTSSFNAIEIDGVVQPSVVSAYTFSTTGEHTVKYTLKTPTIIGSFSGCTSLTSIYIPSGVTSIGYEYFCDCRNLTSISIPNSVTSISSWAFSGCYSLTRLNSNVDGVFNLPSGVTSIGPSAFRWCYGLTRINIPSGVTSISEGAFFYCTSLTRLNSNVDGVFNIPSGVTTIGDTAFYECTSLTSIDIPSGVTRIGQGAFSQCGGLTSITSNATTAPYIYYDTFQDVKTGGTLYVPTGSSGYDVWMGTSTGTYYLGHYNWTKVEQ